MPDVVLSAGADQLPLAFEGYEALVKGTKPAFVDASGAPLVGDALDRELSRLGIGPKRISVEFQYRDVSRFDLAPGHRSVTVAGTLDSQGLARVMHATAREFIEKAKGRGDGTPPESYVTQLRIEPVGPSKPAAAPARKRKAPTKKRTAIERPARQVKQRPAVARRRPGQGKYVRQYVAGANGKRRAVYRDRTTKRFVSEKTWRRSIQAAKRRR